MVTIYTQKENRPCPEEKHQRSIRDTFLVTVYGAYYHSPKAMSILRTGARLTKTDAIGILSPGGFCCYLRRRGLPGKIGFLDHFSGSLVMGACQ